MRRNKAGNIFDLLDALMHPYYTAQSHTTHTMQSSVRRLDAINNDISDVQRAEA